MSQLTSEQFLILLGKSKLLEGKRFDEFVKFSKSSSTATPRELADLLLDRGWITRWQSEKLLSKKCRGFFLGKYRLLQHIGSGGMSRVYLAEHTKIGRRVAIKVLPPAMRQDDAYIDRFRREARAAAQLNHSNIVRAYDVGFDENLHYLVMEFVEGQDLHKRIKNDGPLDFLQAADFVSQAARGLHHAHQAGLIHRDVKPSNLLVTDHDVVKLLDLGLAMFSEESASSETLTNSALVLGTADYLSPEQARNCHDVDHRTDIYSLGCTLYYFLCGHAPFSGGSFAQRILKHQMDQAEPISNWRSNCPPVLEEICQRMMQKRPENRFASTFEIEQQLTQWVQENRKSYDEPTSELQVTQDSEGSIVHDLEPPVSDDPCQIEIVAPLSIVQSHQNRKKTNLRAPMGFWIFFGSLVTICLGLLVFVILKQSN